MDGALEAIERYGLDKNKVGIMGGSFGGYSALQASIVEPEFFKAAVGCSVYDMRLLYSEGDVRGRFSGDGI